MSSNVIDEAIQIAQEAVRADENGDIALAIEKYQRSLAFIQLGLQIKREDETVDNTVLQRYYHLYAERVAMLQQQTSTTDASSRQSKTDVAGCSLSGPQQLFMLDQAEIAQAQPPGPVPTEEWRRAFWLMAILRASMTRGGFLSLDRSVYIPRRVWLQKGAKFTAFASKLDCAECLVNELRAVCATESQQPQMVGRALGSLVETMDSLQNSLARQLPFISEVSDKQHSSAVAKMKGVAKALDRTVGRLGAMPHKCADPHEYIQTLVDLFDAAAFVERWIDHYAVNALENAIIYQQLHRVAKFLYEVVCAFAIHDLHALLDRYIKKASNAFCKATS